MPRFIVVTKHDSGADGSRYVVEKYGQAVDIVHDFFLSYGFEIREGRPFDEGNDDGGRGGFDVFSNVTIYDGRIAGFTHHDGDGPIATIEKTNKRIKIV